MTKDFMRKNDEIILTPVQFSFARSGRKRGHAKDVRRIMDDGSEKGGFAYDEIFSDAIFRRIYE